MRMRRKTRKARALMTTDVVMVNQNDDLRLVDDIMAEHGIRHTPVVHQDRLVGLITQRDMYKA